MTLMEINDPSWAVKGYAHHWSFNRRKDTITTVSDTEFYVLPRDLDKIALVRQTSSPIKLRQVPDEIFYRRIPNPTATGNPFFYRLWEQEGVSTRLAVADTIDIVSGSTSDTAQTVSIVGYDANDVIKSEVLTLNGTTTVAGTITFAANRPLRVSKSASTAGDITVTENSGGTTLVILGSEDRSPRFKVIGFYPIPGSGITISLEYFTRIRRLVNEADVPDIDEKWIWVVRAGALAKIFQYQNKSEDFVLQQNIYQEGVRSMVKEDMVEMDYIPKLARNNFLFDTVPYMNWWFTDYTSIG